MIANVLVANSIVFMLFITICIIYTVVWFIIERRVEQKYNVRHHIRYYDTSFMNSIRTFPISILTSESEEYDIDDLTN